MSDLLIHLTDAHIVAADSVVVPRANSIAAAALSEVMEIDAIHLVFSGDMVQSGQPEEYALLDRFISDLKAEISRLRPTVPIHHINAPGNHDCDFRGDQTLREMVLRSALQDQESINDVVGDTLRAPQASYQEYVERWAGQAAERLSVSCETTRIDGSVKTRYLIFNSALFSRLNEQQGRLLIQIPSKDGVPADSDRVICVMHHPLGWLTPDNARELSQFASAVGDIFLFGHEHEHQGHHIRELYSNTSVSYVHGHLLNEYKDQFNSGFQTIEINKRDGMRVRAYRLDGHSYKMKNDAGFVAWPANKRVRGLGFTDDFYSWLIEPGANFTHRKKAQITLPDVYVWPELRPGAQPKGAESGVLMLAVADAYDEFVANYASLPSVVVVKGGEQFGKSSLAKQICLERNKKGGYSLYLNADNVTTWEPTRVAARLDAVIEDQYGRRSLDEYKQLPPDQKLLVIDNFDLQKLGPGGLRSLKALKTSYGKLILSLDSFPGLDIALNEFLRDEEFVDSAVYDLLPLSYGKRQELIEAWLSIGAEPDADMYDLGVLAARMAKLVDETLGRNFIPAIPLFVLIILQRSELEQDLKTVVKSGSHGFLYEVLINQALSAHVNMCGLDTAVAYLSSLAYEMFLTGGEEESEARYEAFHSGRMKDFDLNLPLTRFSTQLQTAGILVSDGGMVRFKFPYHFYYFLAKELARLEWHQLEPIVTGLSERIHTEYAANVLLFLAHFSRNPAIAAILLGVAKSTLVAYKEIDIFNHHAKFASYSVPQIRQVLLDSNQVVRAKLMDDGSCDEKLSDEAQKEIERAAADRLKSKLDDALAMNKAFKTLQVLGQLLRNMAGSIPKDEKREIARACVDLGLRVLGFLSQLIDENSEELLAFRALQLRVEHTRTKKDGSLYVTKSDAEIAEMLDVYLSAMFANLTMGTFVKISNAVGSEELTPTLSAVLSETKTDQLLLLATELEHFADFPESKVRDFKQEKIEAKHVLPFSILKRFVVRRFHLFPAKKELKEGIASDFGLKTQPFRALQLGKSDSKH